MADEEIMRLAFEEAKKSNEPTGCGVVIVKDGNILAKAHNLQRSTNNPTAHAEMNALKEAGEKVKSKNLEGCTIYCTCEPCIMCLSAIVFAKIPKLVYSTSLRETFQGNLPITLTTEELLKHTDHKIKIVSGVLKRECETLFSK